MSNRYYYYFELFLHTETTTTTTTTTTILRPLYKTTCISRDPQLRTGEFCWRKVYCPHAHADTYVLE